jgi:hypothetical protein
LADNISQVIGIGQVLCDLLVRSRAKSPCAIQLNEMRREE